jgi:hypothetical protein
MDEVDDIAADSDSIDIATILCEQMCLAPINVLKERYVLILPHAPPHICVCMLDVRDSCHLCSAVSACHHRNPVKFQFSITFRYAFLGGCVCLCVVVSE